MPTQQRWTAVASLKSLSAAVSLPIKERYLQNQAPLSVVRLLVRAMEVGALLLVGGAMVRVEARARKKASRLWVGRRRGKSSRMSMHATDENLCTKR